MKDNTMNNNAASNALPGADALVGTSVEWELSGRGRGTIVQGEVVKYIPKGTTNEDALDELVEEMREEGRHLRVRPKYCRFAMETRTTPRYFVLVEQDTKRVRPIFYIYAPNAHEVVPV